MKLSFKDLKLNQDKCTDTLSVSLSSGLTSKVKFSEVSTLMSLIKAQAKFSQIVVQGRCVSNKYALNVRLT